MPIKLVLSLVVILSVLQAQAATLEMGTSVVRVSSNDHILILNRKDPEDPEADPKNIFLHENALRMETGPLVGSLQFSNRMGISENAKSQTNPFILEKKLAAAEWSNFELRFGDTHQEFGRGIALSLYKDDVFGLDNTVEGASFRYHPKFVDALVFGGRLNALKIPLALNAVDNPLKTREVYMAGTSVASQVSPTTKVSGHYLLALNQPNESRTTDKTWHTVGATVLQEDIGGAIDAYAESNLLFSQLTIGQEAQNLPTGIGTYGALTWSPANWRVKWEVKDYEQYNFEFRRPPTLEEDIVETTNAVDIVATRLTAERKLDATTSVSAAAVTGYDRQEGIAYYHGIAGTKFHAPLRSEWELKGGYRWMPEHNNLLHAQIKAKIHTAKGQSLELSALKLSWNKKLNVFPTADDKNIFSLTYNFSERFNAGVGYEYVPTNDIEAGQHFFNTGGTARLGAFVAKAFIGQTSGGTLCSGGVCRQVPAFTGASFESTYQF